MERQRGNPTLRPLTDKTAFLPPLLFSPPAHALTSLLLRTLHRHKAVNRPPQFQPLRLLGVIVEV